ncbi:transposase [Streptomyces sp. NBC_00986]|uniref:transposase n=1 Tax=Streptomyces sp. NBC_00986 TaxID=2903702 RepID=UPI003863BAEC
MTPRSTQRSSEKPAQWASCLVAGWCALSGAGVCGLRTRYSTDLSDAEWEILRPLVPAVKSGGRPAKHMRREILNALAYWLRAGCAWRLLPHDLPPWQTVYQRSFSSIDYVSSQQVPAAEWALRYLRGWSD